MNEENNITGDRLTNIPTVFREDVEQDVSMTVQVQLDKAGITEHKIADVLDTATAVMRPVESEEDLRALQDVLTPIVRLRTNIVRICKKGREHANMVSKAWIAAEKLHVAEVSKVEAKLDAYKQEWKEAQERAKAEEEAEAKRIINERFAALEGLGMVRRVATADKPERYEVGDVSVSIDTIETCDLARWEDVVARATAAAQELRRQADERAQAEQAAREALEKRERDLAAREARANKVLDGERAAELDALGAVALERPADPLRQYDDDQWAEEVRQVKVLVDRRVAEEREAAARAEAEAKQRAEREAKDREEREARIAAEAAQRERERIEAEAKAKAEEEAERLRQAGDAGVLAQCLADTGALRIKLLTAHDALKSTIGTHGLTSAGKHVAAAIAVLQGTLNDVSTPAKQQQ